MEGGAAIKAKAGANGGTVGVVGDGVFRTEGERAEGKYGREGKAQSVVVARGHGESIKQSGLVEAEGFGVSIGAKQCGRGIYLDGGAALVLFHK